MTTAHGCSHEGHLAAIVEAIPADFYPLMSTVARVAKLGDERDHYRTTLIEIAHLEDSPAASAHIAAAALGIELPPHLDRGKG